MMERKRGEEKSSFPLLTNDSAQKLSNDFNLLHSALKKVTRSPGRLIPTLRDVSRSNKKWVGGAEWMAPVL